MTSPVLKLPAYKVLLHQLSSARQTNSIYTPFSQWNVIFKCKSEAKEKIVCESNTVITVSNVWIQGRIEFVDEDSVVVNDGTGSALVVGLSKLPLGKQNLSVNKYVMVIGHVLSVGPMIPAISCDVSSKTDFSAKLKAIKVTDISNSMNCRTGSWWNKEVLHAQNMIVLSSLSRR